MEQKLTCDTIRDLLPMYVDEMTSEATNELVKEQAYLIGLWEEQH